MRGDRRQRPAANIAAQIEELLRIRREADETATLLIRVLDEAERDPDIEDNGDAEEEPDREDGADDEPSLGSSELLLGRMMFDGTAMWPQQEQRVDAGFDQARWCTGDDDREEEFDGREPDMDGEEEPDREIEHEGGEDHYAI